MRIVTGWLEVQKPFFYPLFFLILTDSGMNFQASMNLLAFSLYYKWKLQYLFTVPELVLDGPASISTWAAGRFFIMEQGGRLKSCVSSLKSASSTEPSSKGTVLLESVLKYLHSSTVSDVLLLLYLGKLSIKHTGRKDRLGNINNSYWVLSGCVFLFNSANTL